MTAAPNQQTAPIRRYTQSVDRNSMHRLINSLITGADFGVNVSELLRQVNSNVTTPTELFQQAEMRCFYDQLLFVRYTELLVQLVSVFLNGAGAPFDTLCNF